MHLFTYGTLMIPELMHSVAGNTFPGCSALLPDYARYRMRHASYPAVVPETGSDTAGTVYLDVDAFSLARIDAFEGPEYVREWVKLSIEGSRCLEAQTYVLDPACRDRLSEQPWSLSYFREHHLRQFMRDFFEGEGKEVSLR